jgi:ABC-type uncharacterized transport system involved in gliding motility auxiliary subunit
MLKKILNIVGWIGTALVVAAVVVRVLISQGRVGANWDAYAKYGAWAGLACVVLYTLGQWREIADYFSRRNARYGAIAGVSVLVFLGILVAANYLSFRQNKRWDLTKNQQYTLSDQTISTSTSRHRRWMSSTSTRTSGRSRRASTRCRATARSSSTTWGAPSA